MKLIPREWEEFPTLTGLRRQMNRLFEYFPNAEEPGFEWWPAVNVAETPETVVVTAEMPGLDPKDIEISVVGDTLTIRGEKRFDKEEKGIEDSKKLVAKNKLTFPVLSDRFNFLARRYLGDRSPLPSVFLVRSDGTIARVEKGYNKDAATFLMSEIRKELGAAKAPAPASAER